MKPLDKHERRLAVALWFAACIIVGAVIGYARGATIERTVPAGTKLIVTRNGVDETLATVDKEPVTLVLTPAPATQPAPQPTPSPAPLIPPAGVTVVRLPALSTSTLTLKSNTWYIPAGESATVKADTPCRIPSNTVNAAVVGDVNFIGNGDHGYGINAVGTTGIQNILFYGGSCRNVTDGCAIHGPKIEGPCVHRNITFRKWRMLDTGGDLFNEGQGWYVANVNGLTIDQCFADKLGTGQIGIGTHAAYIAAGCLNVVIRDSWASHVESVGWQARGPLVRYTDADDGKDPGPQITGCLEYDAAIGVMVNGPRAAVRDNLFFAGHHAHSTNPVNTGGEAGIYASVGQLRLTNNARAHSPVKDTGTMFSAWFNNPRSDAAVDAGVKYQWGWSRPCATVENTGNVDRLSIIVNLDDLVTRGRNGEDVVGLLGEARRRAHVAGVN